MADSAYFGGATEGKDSRQDTPGAAARMPDGIKRDHQNVSLPGHEKYEGGEPLMQFFSFAHLPAHLQGTSQLFYGIAARICTDIPVNQQRTKALEKLLEAKDCAVRAVIYK